MLASSCSCTLALSLALVTLVPPYYEITQANASVIKVGFIGVTVTDMSLLIS